MSVVFNKASVDKTDALFFIFPTFFNSWIKQEQAAAGYRAGL